VVHPLLRSSLIIFGCQPTPKLVGAGPMDCSAKSSTSSTTSTGSWLRSGRSAVPGLFSRSMSSQTGGRDFTSRTRQSSAVD
jgi:hypothetical protein